MRTKIIMIAAMLAVIVAMTGTAAAYDLIINQGSPNQGNTEPSNILLAPGVPHISSLQGSAFGGATPQTFPLNSIVECHFSNLACHPDDIVVTFNHVLGITNPFPSLGPIMDNNLPFLAKDSLTMTLNNIPQDPVGTQYIFTIKGGPGNTSGEVASASRTITSVPPPASQAQLIPLAGDLDGDGVDSYGTFDINTA
jgi:hypothetical protein